MTAVAIFDLDNTIVHSRIDFAGIRRDVVRLLNERDVTERNTGELGHLSIGQIIALGEAHDAANGTDVGPVAWQIVLDHEREGMRAQLRSGSIVTGERYVALDFFTDATPATVDWSLAEPVVPTVPSTLPEMQAKLEAILVKVDSIPFQKIGGDLAETLESARKMLDGIDTEVTPELKSTLAELRTTLAAADKVLEGADRNITSTDGPTLQALQQALDEVAGAARALRSLADYLERHPEALIQGKPEE